MNDPAYEYNTVRLAKPLVEVQQLSRILGAWEQQTRALCEAGYLANSLITDSYDRKEFNSLARASTPVVSRFRSIVAEREKFWLHMHPTRSRAEDWLHETRRTIDLAEASSDRLAMLRAWVWAVYSTLPLIIRLEEQVSTILRLDDLRGEFHSLITRTEPRLFCGDWSNEGASSLFFHQETGEAFFRRHGKKNFINIYRLRRDDVSRYVEVVESWRFADDAGVSICIPLGVGCPNTCAMCDLGTYFGGNLRPPQIVSLLLANLRMDYGMPLLDPFRYLTIYLLGGGDAFAYPWISELAASLQGNFPNAQLIFSTIGLKRPKAFETLLDCAAANSRMGFQISICSLSPEMRARFVDGNAAALNVQECVNYLERFYDRTARKGYAALFLPDDSQSALDSLITNAERLIDRSKIHLTLTVMRPNSLEFSRHSAGITACRRAQECLSERGFETHVCHNDEDPENAVSCGVMEGVVLEGNRGFMKGAKK